MVTTDLEGFRFSVQQAHLWSQGKKCSMYRALCTLLIQGDLDRMRLVAALQRVVDRHEILRTKIHFLPGMDVPVQVIAYHSTCICPVISLERLNISQQREKLDALLTSVQEKEIDLEHLPLLSTCLLQLSAKTHVLVISLPALCADAPTLRLLVTELQQLYTACLDDEVLIDEPLQYADVSAWQNELLLEEEATQQIRYWREIDLFQLATVKLPFCRDNHTHNRTLDETDTDPLDSRWLQIPLDDALANRLRVQAQQYNCTVAAYLLACWQIVLGRLSNEEHFLVGVACDGRTYEELANALGLYTRFVPMRAHCESALSFEQHLLDVNTSLQEVYQRQLYFNWGLARDADNAPIPLSFFPLSFEYEIWPASFTLGDLTFSLSKCFSYTEPFTLKLSVLEIGERLQLELYYDQRRVAADQVQRLASAFQTLLLSAVEGPRTAIGQLNILAANEYRYIQEISQASTRSLPAQLLHQLFEAQAAKYPEQPAVMDAHETLTYQELNCRANQLAHALRRAGVGPNVLVALCVSRSVEMIVSLLAILKAGGVYVPFDPSNPPARLAFQLQDSRASFLLTQQALVSLFPDWQGTIFCLDALAQEVKGEPTGNLMASNEAGDLAYVIYTSGSTGVPKGVMIQQRSVLNYTLALCELLQCEPGWHYATVSTLAADLGNTVIFCALASGGCLQVLDYETIISGEAFANWMSLHPIDVLKIVPSHLSALLKGVPSLVPRRALLLGGEALPFDLLARLREIGGTCVVYNHYGPTEATIGTLVNPLGSISTAGAVEQQVGKSRTVPLGRPIANSEVYILDHNLQMVPVGVEGELYLGGVGLASGYWHNPEQTAERFIPHPFVGGYGASGPGARLYRTGDLAFYTEEKQIEFVGRRDSQVKLRGYRIELGEIETMLRSYPAVMDAAVVLRDDVATEPCIVGYVVLKQKSLSISKQLNEFVRERLPEYMAPFTYVFLETLPLTANGKVERQRLPRPDLAKNDEPNISQAPRNPIEEMLLNIWKELLSVSEIGIHDNFFHLGGHSLLAMQVISQIRALSQVDLPISSFFETPTVAALAALLELKLGGEHSAKAHPLVPVSRDQFLPLSFAQQRLWFLAQLERNSSTFNKFFGQRLHGKLNVKALVHSLSTIVQRHEVLRTTFQVVQGKPVQVIHAAGTFLLPLIDLSSLMHEEREHAIQQLVRQETLRPFDIARGPLLRVLLLHLAVDEHILVLSTHHITSDAWSNAIFMRELATLYTAFVNGKAAQLPRLPIQYADFAVWQAQWLQGEVFDAQMRYWTRHLEGLVPLKLPTDHPRPRRQTFRGAHLDIVFTAQLSNDLRMLSQREGLTLFMTLLTSFQILLACYSGQDDIVVGTDVANRNRAEIENLIGFFVNQLVLRIDLSGNPTLRELLQRSGKTALQAYVHQDVPFEKLVEALNPERSTQLSPLFQVKIVLQNTPMESRAIPGIVAHPLATDTDSAKLDLVLFLEEREEELWGSFVYNADLFDATTISRYAEHLRLVLETFVIQPDIRLDALKSMIKKEQELQKMETKSKAFPSLKAIKPKPMNLRNDTLVQMDLLQPETVLPLVIRPRNEGLDLIEWTKNNLQLLETELLKHGVLLFRGFHISSPGEFESFASTICPELFGENSEHPREEVSENVYTPVFYPPEKKLLWHNENSFNASWPVKIWFCCGKPADQGGETPVVDSRQVFQAIDPAIREQFMRKNVMYVRNYGDGLGLHWSTVFRTTDKAEVEAYCQREAIEFEWKDGDRLRTRQIRPAVLKHPKTGEYVWWNQATHWHPACLEPDVRESLAQLFAEEDLPRNCYYGDGSPIEDEAMRAICDAYQKLEVSFPWQLGDIMMLDNMLAAHARNPFQGKRKIYVALGEMMSLDDLEK